MRCFTKAIAVIAVLLILAACGGGLSSTTPPALQSGSAPDTGGMPTAPIPPILPQRAPVLNPLELPLELALARLPDRGVALFAQDTQEQVVRDLPLELAAEDGADGLSIAVRTTEEMELPDSLLLHLRFDPAKLAPVRADFNENAFTEGSHLLLAVTDAPGYVPLGAVRLPGAAPVTVAAGTELARIEFSNHAQTASKAACAAPSGDGNKVELNLTLSGPEQQDINLWFEERNLGDYDLNGTVSISDITPIAVHFGETSGVSLPVIDGSGNNKVDIADITALAQNFGHALSGYDLEVEFTPEGGETQAFTRIPNATNPDQPTLTRPNVTLPSGWPIYSYQLADRDFGQYRLRAVAMGASLADSGVESDTRSATVVNLPPAPPQSFYVSATTRTSVTMNWSQSTSTDLLGYNVYITQDSAANELADFTQVNTELLPSTTQELTATELTPTTDYWFVIEAVDEALQQSLESAVMDTKVMAQTVIAPVAVLNVEAGDHYETYAIAFDADGSSSPDGAELVGFTYDWDDGTPAEAAPPPGEATHTYAAPHPGGVTVKLTVTDEYGAEGVAQAVVPVLALRRDVLVIYNSNSADDLEIANYYASPETGRAIHPSCVHGMDLSMSQAIDYPAYLSTIRDPLKTYITDSTLNSLEYIVTTKDVPLQISTAGPTDPPPPDEWNDNLKLAYNYTNTRQACVDSELTLLFQNHDTISWKVNPYYGHLSSNPDSKGVPASSQAWQPAHFSVNELDNDDLTNEVFHWPGETYTLDYLVTRLSGWSKEDAMAIVDRSKAADTAVVTNYVVVFDDANKGYDMMNDTTADGTESAVDVFQRLGLTFFADTVHLSPPNESIEVFASTLASYSFNPEVVMGYCSHGVHAQDPDRPRYIIEDLSFGYLPGALFMSYESFNGNQFRGDPYTHTGHGQVADWIMMGGTGGIGNVYEPLSSACGDESIIFAEYVHCGRNLAESLYKGLRYVSWMEVVIGDPLCKLNMP